MIDFAVGDNPFRLVVVVTTRVQIAREPREVAARDFNSEAVSVVEIVAR